MDEDLKFLNALVLPIIEKYRPLGRSGLLPTLQDVQKANGWLSPPILEAISEGLKIPLADIHGVVEFYSLFYTKMVGEKIARICLDPACALKGSSRIYEQLLTSQRQGKIDPNLPDRVEEITCLGLCDHAPGIMINENVVRYEPGDNERFSPSFPVSKVFGNIRWITENCGQGSATPLNKYGEYSALKKAWQNSPDALIQEIKASGLLGRGGAAFPTGIKWESTRAAEGQQKYVVCNADESEPGTFKDRVLLADDPHSIIEGMCIAAYAIGASKGYIYLRGEYAYLLPGLENALKEARKANYLNNYFDITVRLGAGAYICGEETALFESIEGKRGFPRVKPPFPTTSGLFNCPTVINNVETLCNIPLIVKIGANEYRKIGSEKSPGTKLFCLSGDVAEPGLYEVPFGISLRNLLGMAKVNPTPANIQAILIGGAAGAFASYESLDVRLTLEDLRSANLPLGSGVITVFDGSRDLREILQRLGAFFAHESCGKCYPCQLGTQRQKEILDKVANGTIDHGDVERLQDVGWTMTDASLCGLGQTAASAVLSAIKLFPHLFLLEQK